MTEKISASSARIQAPVREARPQHQDSNVNASQLKEASNRSERTEKVESELQQATAEKRKLAEA